MERFLIKKLFAEGALTAAYIQPAPMETDRYMLSFKKINGTEEPATYARTSTMKLYKRVSSAMKDVERIGFNEVTIRFK